MFSPVSPIQEPSVEDEGSSARILIVDDEAMNRRILGDILSASGYTILTAADGAECLEICTAESVDLILLDVMMPGMDGFEVCSCLKQLKALEAVPIIFATALDDRVHRLRGIEVGATDFISKPIDSQYLKLQVKNAVSAKRLHDCVTADFVKLKELQEMKDDLTKMIVHDLRSPLMGISGHLELLKTFDRELPEDARECVEIASGEAGWMTTMISSILDIGAMEEGKLPVRLTACDVGEFATRAVAALGPRAEGLQLNQQVAAGEMAVSADSQLFDRILVNLIANAVKFGSTEIEVSAGLARTGIIRIVVADNGCGIPEESQDQVFSKFVSSHSGDAPSTGLGLSFCKMAIEALDGVIGLSSQPGVGTTVSFELPEAEASSASLTGLAG